jgi:hypothetical protein
MSKSVLSLKLYSVLAIATATSAIGLFGIKSLNAAPSDNLDRSSEMLVAYENMCADDELMAGDEVTVEGETYTLAEDEDGLFIEYIRVDEEGEDTGEGVGTYSLTEFGDDCETASFEQVDGTDSIIGEDVDEEGEEMGEEGEEMIEEEG